MGNSCLQIYSKESDSNESDNNFIEISADNETHKIKEEITERIKNSIKTGSINNSYIFELFEHVSIYDDNPTIELKLTIDILRKSGYAMKLITKPMYNSPSVITTIKFWPMSLSKGPNFLTMDGSLCLVYKCNSCAKKIKKKNP